MYRPLVKRAKDEISFRAKLPKLPMERRTLHAQIARSIIVGARARAYERSRARATSYVISWHGYLMTDE